MQKSTDELISSIGILSLSKISSDILMWSHYANSHKGFCIRLIDDDQDPFIGRALDVKYLDEYPVVNPIKDNDRTRMEKSLLTKAKNWEYEQEWRIIDYQNGPGVQIIPKRIMAGVIFGCRMSDQHEASLREWCASYDENFSFFKAEESAHTFCLEIDEV